MSQPFVSVVLLSWNRKKDITDTLSDLRQQTYQNFEIVVVDQNSDDGTPEAIKYDFPEVKLFELEKNIGLSAGRNYGIKKAKGEILVFLDNDAFLEKEGIEKLVKKFDERPDIGIIGCKILNYFTKELEAYSWVYPKFKKKDCDQEFETYTYCGAGHAIRREVFEEIGLYWEDLFIYWDENDLSLRALNKGIKILYYPDVKVQHRFSPEKRAWTAKNYYLIVRNSMWVNWRSFPLPAALAATVVRTCAYIVKGVRNKCLGAILKGTWDAHARWYLLFDRKEKMSKQAYRQYKSLNQQGPFWWRTKTLLFGEH